MLFDYLFWVLSHVHRKENKGWNTFVTCSALSIFIFAYLFFTIHVIGFFLKENLFFKIENNFSNDELLLLGVFMGLTFILNYIYSKRRDLLAQKVKQRLPTYKDYLKVFSLLILPLILMYIIR